MIYRLSMHIHRDMMPVKLVETSPFAGIRGLYLREGGVILSSVLGRIQGSVFWNMKGRPDPRASSEGATRVDCVIPCWVIPAEVGQSQVLSQSLISSLGCGSHSCEHPFRTVPTTVACMGAIPLIIRGGCSCRRVVFIGFRRYGLALYKYILTKLVTKCSYSLINILKHTIFFIRSPTTIKMTFSQFIFCRWTIKMDYEL